MSAKETQPGTALELGRAFFEAAVQPAMGEKEWLDLLNLEAL